MKAIYWIGGIAVALLVIAKAIPQSVMDLIKKHEGWRDTVYLDSAGKKTIGYGHLILPGETFTRITKEQGEALLQADMTRIWNAIKGNITRPISDNQKAAIMCFAFNVGATAFNNSTLLKKLNTGDYTGAAAEFLKWNKVTVNGVKQESKGLTNRRNERSSNFS
jgi:lysozyme